MLIKTPAILIWDSARPRADQASGHWPCLDDGPDRAGPLVRLSRVESPPATSAMTLAGARLGWPRYPGPGLAGGEPPGAGGEPLVARWN